MRLLTLAAVLVALAPGQAWASVPIPEPTSLTLLAVGLGGAALFRFGRRRRK